MARRRPAAPGGRPGRSHRCRARPAAGPGPRCGRGSSPRPALRSGRPTCSTIRWLTAAETSWRSPSDAGQAPQAVAEHIGRSARPVQLGLRRPELVRSARRPCGRSRTPVGLPASVRWHWRPRRRSRAMRVSARRTSSSAVAAAAARQDPGRAGGHAVPDSRTERGADGDAVQVETERPAVGGRRAATLHVGRFRRGAHAVDHHVDQSRRVVLHDRALATGARTRPRLPPRWFVSAAAEMSRPVGIHRDVG